MAKRVIDASERLVVAERKLKEWVDQNASDPRRHLDRMRQLLDEERIKPEGADEESLKLIEAAVARAEGDFLARNRSGPVGTEVIGEKTKPASAPAGPNAGMMIGMPGMMGGEPGQAPVATEEKPLEKDRSLEAEDEADRTKNELIREALLEKISMPFGQPTPLEDVFKYIKTSSTSEKMPTGLPIYIDPKTWEEEQYAQVVIDLDGVPLKTTLRLVLRQLDLGFYIRDGLLMIAPLNSYEYQYRDRTAGPGLLIPPYRNTPAAPRGKTARESAGRVDAEQPPKVN